MELLPIIIASGTGFLSTLNAYFLKKQSSRLQMVESKSKIGISEIQKLIQEKDEVVGYIYKLYNIANELDQIISSILSLLYVPSTSMKGTIRKSTFYVNYTQEPEKWINKYKRLHSNVNTSLHIEEQINFNSKYELEYCLHPDVNAYVYAISQLLHWIEIKKTNRTAIHAFHSGPLHIAIENISRFLHATIEQRLRIPLIRQKGIGQQMEKYNSKQEQTSDELMSSEIFVYLMSDWKTHLPKHHPPEIYVPSEIESSQHVQHTNGIINDDYIEELPIYHQNPTISNNILSAMLNNSQNCQENQIPVDNIFERLSPTISDEVYLSSSPSPSPLSSSHLSSSEVSPNFKKELKTSNLFLSIIPIDIKNEYNYLITSRKQKHELLKHYNFNKHFKQLFDNTYHLFFDIGKEQQKFEKYYLDKVIISGVVKMFIFKYKRFVLTKWKLLTTLFNENNTHTLQTEQTLNCSFETDENLKYKFQRAILNIKNIKLLKKVKSYIKNCNFPHDTQKIQKKMIALYKPILFEVYMSKQYSEVYEFSNMIKTLIHETDKVIREDSKFREKLMS